MPRSASVVGLAKRGVIPRKQFYIKLFFYNTVILGRRAKFYSLTRAGQKQLEKQAADWERLSSAISQVMRLEET
jgi:predicted ArsR family transcriptional regulator